MVGSCVGGTVGVAVIPGDVVGLTVGSEVIPANTRAVGVMVRVCVG